MTSLVTIDLKNPATLVHEYMGWSRSRHFNPKLILYSLTEDLYIHIEGYTKIWQFLDTICYKEPLPRQNFNNVLKHRVESEHTSKEIISGIISECDLDAVTFHGVILEKNPWPDDADFFSVDFTYSHFDEDIHPPLVEIADVFSSHSPDTILFDNFEVIHRLKNNDWKRMTHTFPSVIMLKRYQETQTHRDGLLAIRCVQFPNGNLGFFSNTFISNKKYACNSPLMVHKMDDKVMQEWLSQCFNLFHRTKMFLTKSKSLDELPLWKQENTSGSTVSHHQANAKLFFNYLIRVSRAGQGTLSS